MLDTHEIRRIKSIRDTHASLPMHHCPCIRSRYPLSPNHNPLITTDES